MKVYFDTCCLNRPLDQKTNTIIILEAEAVLALLSLVEHGGISIVDSDVLRFEIQRNPNPTFRETILSILAKAIDYIELNDAIITRAKTFEGQGIKSVDALHLASAECNGIEVLCTSDIAFFKKAQTLVELNTRVVMPLDLIREVSNAN